MLHSMTLQIVSVLQITTKFLKLTNPPKGLEEAESLDSSTELKGEKGKPHSDKAENKNECNEEDQPKEESRNSQI